MPGLDRCTRVAPPAQLVASASFMTVSATILFMACRIAMLLWRAAISLAHFLGTGPALSLLETAARVTPIYLPLVRPLNGRAIFPALVGLCVTRRAK